MELNAAQLSRERHWPITGWGFAAALLATPLVAMEFTADVRWTAFDFVFAAGMIGSVGIGLELAARTRNTAYRLGAAVALLAAFLLVWITGAVGFIGDEGNPANLMFLGVIAIALAGSVTARFRPAGMAGAMAIAAAAQFLLGLTALILLLGADEPPGPWGIQLLNGAFVGLWLLSAACFRRAQREAVLA